MSIEPEMTINKVEEVQLVAVVSSAEEERKYQNQESSGYNLDISDNQVNEM